MRRVAFQNDHTRIIHLRGSMIPRAATDRHRIGRTFGPIICGGTRRAGRGHRVPSGLVPDGVCRIVSVPARCALCGRSIFC